MFPSRCLLLWLLLAFSGVCASSVSRGAGKVTLKLSRAINLAGTGNLADRDRARARSIVQHRNRSDRSAISKVNAANAATFYAAEVGIGTPPTYYTLLVDTGSSITWVGAGKQYAPTNSSVNTLGLVHMIYGTGAFFGELWRDTVMLSSDLVIPQQAIGVANLTVDMSGFDGILGLGPMDLTLGAATNMPEVPTIADNLYQQGTIPQEVVGVFFSPAPEPQSAGTLTFGGFDDAAITSPVNYIPLTKTFPASAFWGIDQSISYGDDTILSPTAGIVDTGTTLILIATGGHPIQNDSDADNSFLSDVSGAFKRYQALTGATLDSATGLLTITSSQYASLRTLSFNIGSSSYNLTANAQIWPRSLNSALGGSSGVIYLVVNDLGFTEGLFFDFINGYCFLERYYSIFDTNNERFGIAETIYTHSDSN